MAQLKDLILRTELKNTDENGVEGNSDFNTKDYAYIEAFDEVKHYSSEERMVSSTDYARANDAYVRYDLKSKMGKKGTTEAWLRSGYSYTNDYARAIYPNGDSNLYVVNGTGGVRVALHLNLKSVISAQSAGYNFGKIVNRGEYYAIEMGEYPQSKAKNSEELERLFQEVKIIPTGKTYRGIFDYNKFCFSENKEYTYGGKRYVRARCQCCEGVCKFADGLSALEGEYEWFEVEPIKWEIKNWYEMPKEINANGNGQAKYIDVRTEEVVLSPMPFYASSSGGKKNINLWQNSLIRAYLNGYDLHAEIKSGNGNETYIAGLNYNFEGKGFLQEAFDKDLSKVDARGTMQGSDFEDAQEVVGSRKTRLEKLNPDSMPKNLRRNMTDTELIKSWIDAGQSVLLRGPSGIGKTERLKELYPDLIYIKLTNNMFPEKVVGSMNLQTGQNIPPDFAKHALLACATEEEKKLVNENIQNLYELADTIYERSKTADGKIVILLDELLNVKPAVQSLVYTLVLNKLVETGKGLKLPAHTVVVATGNQKKYSAVAEDLAEPLEKRFDHILDMQPKVDEWLYEYAIPKKIHPAVIGYILTKKQQDINGTINYFYEEPEVGETHLDQYGCKGRTNDPRGWVAISNSLYAFEEDLQKGKFKGMNVEYILQKTLDTKLRAEWAEEFFDYYVNPTLTVQEVIENSYTKADLPRDINEKFATIAGLLTATPQEVGACRDFIRKYCDPEYLSLYDLYWVGNDEDRMEKLDELKQLSEFDNANNSKRSL